MGHYDTDYEHDDQQRRGRAARKRHDLLKAIRQAIDLVDVADAYDAHNVKTKLHEAIFWVDGPTDN